MSVVWTDIMMISWFTFIYVYIFYKNLFWSFWILGSECPSACNTRPKSDFHQADGDSSNKFVRRGRKGKKKQKVAKEEETGNEKEVDPGNGGNASGSESDSGSSPVTTNTTRDNSPSPDGDSSGIYFYFLRLSQLWANI